MTKDSPLSQSRFLFPKEVWRGLYALSKPYKGYVLVVLFSLMLGALTLLLFGLGIRFLIDQGFSSHSPLLLNRSVFFLIILSVFMAIASFSRSYFSTLFAEKVVRDLKRLVYQKFLSLSPSFFETFRVGEILTLLHAETVFIRSVLGPSLSTGLRSVLQALGSVGMLIYTSPKLAGILFLLIPIIIGPLSFLGKRVKKLGRSCQDRLSDEGAYIEETFNGILTVQAFCQEKKHLETFSAFLTHSLRATWRYTFLRACLVAYVIVMMSLSLSFLLWVGGMETLQGVLSPGELGSFVFFGFIGGSSISSVLDLSGDLQRALVSAERLFEILKRPPLLKEKSSPLLFSSEAKGSLDVQEVSFSYPSRPEHLSLQNVSFGVKAGEKVALVGPSGAGKTTLLNLFLRFYDPLRGKITLDGRDLRDVSLEDLRTRIGFVPQNPYIFNASVYENIVYASPQASLEEVKAAAACAFIHDFVETLPEGYNTLLGEKGIRFSAGQKQRLAMARIFLKNPLVLLLDEATNALDSQSESRVQKALEKVMAHRTTVIVAHRLSTVQSADRIFVINEGQIVAQGTHASLMATQGLYQHLVRLQFGGEETSDPIVSPHQL